VLWSPLKQVQVMNLGLAAVTFRVLAEVMDEFDDRVIDGFGFSQVKSASYVRAGWPSRSSAVRRANGSRFARSIRQTGFFVGQGCAFAQTATDQWF
jgi:hypothetical protein